MYNILAETYQYPGEEERFAKGIKGFKTKRNGIKAVKLLGVKALVDKNTKERYLSYNGEIEWGNDANTTLSVRTFENPHKNEVIHFNIR